MTKNSIRIQREIADIHKSKLHAYSKLIIGKPGFWSILKYELIILLVSRTPGALGLWLRAKLYPSLLGKCGKNVFFGTNIVLRHPHKIKIGNDVIIDDNCLLDAKGIDNNGITIEDDIFLGRNSILSCKNGNITLHNDVNIGFNSEIFSASNVTIGKGTYIAAYCYLIGGDHKVDDLNASITEQESTSYGITIGETCWIGAGVKILDKTTIGDHCILGANAVVTKNIPEYSVAVGVPAKVIKDRRNPKK